MVTDSALKRPRIQGHVECPYLDTINRDVLDFDFEKLCSISLSRNNVYACLVCGKYFAGRGKSTNAYIHSVDTSDGAGTGHHVFMHLTTGKFYCLPDNYEIHDSSLADIVYVLNPTYDADTVANIDKLTGLASKQMRAHNGELYWPGVVGLNNIKASDYCNVIFQALSQVKPVRDFFLLRRDTTDETMMVVNDSAKHQTATDLRPNATFQALLLHRFGELVRKLWNPRHFRPHVSPHEMVQAIVLSSSKRFEITKQSDSIDFLSWFLNALHLALAAEAKRKTKVSQDGKSIRKPGHKNDDSIIYKTFRGKMRIYSKNITSETMSAGTKDSESDWTVKESPFLFLTVELPSAPLFKDELQENIIPQVSIYNLLSKFNGQTEREYKTYKSNTLKKFELVELPPYLILVIQRFAKNAFFTEKNPTIVNFPVKSIDLFVVKDGQQFPVNYDLVANIVHDGPPDAGKYRTHILHAGSGHWFAVEDLHIERILPEILPLSESYIQIYQRQSSES